MTDSATADDVGSYEGDVIANKYRVEHLIGTGGMGSVWRAVHVQHGYPVAVKFIRPALLSRADTRRRFDIEARAAARVDSPYAVRVYEHGETRAGVPFMVMELLEGETLADRVARCGPLPLQESARILLQASRALDRAHALGIFHRDLKPDNLFLATNVARDDDDLPYTVKVVDFGIAKLRDDSPLFGPAAGPTQAGMVVGTPGFMSPEQLIDGGQPDALTDIWTLGVTFFIAAVGSLPFEGEVLGETVVKVCTAELPRPSALNPALTPAFDAWFYKACARKRKQRFASVREMSEALAAIGDDPSSLSTHDGVGEASPMPHAPADSDDAVATLRKPMHPATIWRRRVLWMLLGAGVAALVWGAWVWRGLRVMGRP